MSHFVIFAERFLFLIFSVGNIPASDTPHLLRYCHCASLFLIFYPSVSSSHPEASLCIRNEQNGDHFMLHGHLPLGLPSVYSKSQQNNEIFVSLLLLILANETGRQGTYKGKEEDWFFSYPEHSHRGGGKG